MPPKSKSKRPKRNKTLKSPSAWTKHLRMCMDKYGLTYSQARQDGKCRNLYYLGHE